MKDYKVTIAPEHIIQCDFCKEKAIYDAKTKMSCWAYMCRSHFLTLGVGLGQGEGQELVYNDGKEIK